ncbi:hypothetical protein D3C84_879470 [compost metagenome]
MERAGHNAGDRILGQTGAHAEAIELAQRGQGCRGHQRTMGNVPQIAPQHFSREDRAGVDLDVEQRPALGQGQPARHRRAVLGVLGGEGQPQLPGAPGARQQAAEQRVPLFGLMAGNTDIDFGIHTFFQQFGQTGEQIGQA